MSGLRFAGYAALFDRPDAGRDTIRRGAFAASLSARRDPMPLYWQHRPQQRIGWIESIGEDARGLRVIGRIDNPDGGAGLALKGGATTGLSFGFRAREAEHSPTGRTLHSIDIFEVSLVARPMQHGARVHFITRSPLSFRGGAARLGEPQVSLVAAGWDKQQRPASPPSPPTPSPEGEGLSACPRER